MNHDTEGSVIFIAGVCLVTALATGIAAWLRHLMWTVTLLASGHDIAIGQVALGIIGALVPPVGMIHGFVLWFS